MEKSYRNKLLREATKNPEIVATDERFWKLDWWQHYLRRCDELLFDDPRAGLAFAKPAPRLAAKIAEANPGANGADLMLLAYSYVGSGYRAVGEYDSGNGEFRKAGKYKASASPKALAEHLRRLAYLRLFQKNAECFEIIGDAIAIHKRGSLVDRHALGECLLCRGHAYYEFDQPGKSLQDLTASLNHISIKIDDKPYHCALHNLAVWAADHGTDSELQTALDNLKPAVRVLNTTHRTFAKLKARWLMAVIKFRLGDMTLAEEVYLEVRKSLVEMKLPHEVGMIQIDLALLYLAQGQRDELEKLIDETTVLFREIGVEAKAQEALDVWCQAGEVDEALLKRVRRMFAAVA